MHIPSSVQVRSGSVLPVSLVLTAIMAMALGGYMKLVQAQRFSSARSLEWNTLMPLVEAGIEEALTQIRFNGTNQIANNNWTLVDGKYLMKSRAFAGGDYSVGITVTGSPMVVSQGFRRVPLGTNTFWRSVRVKTKLESMFPDAMVADLSIDLNGKNVHIDSFDSSDSNYSTNGLYTADRAKDNGNIVTNSELADSVDTGNAVIKGKIATGPGGSVEVGPNGSVGNSTWTGTGIQPGATSHDANIDLPPIVAPYTSGVFAPLSGSVNGTNYTYVLNGGDFLISSSQGFQGKVLVSAPSRLVVTSSFQFSGQDYIYIATNASLSVYVTCATASLSGQGLINDSARAENFAYYGTPTNTKISFSGNAQFTGAIYAPSADLTLGGGGNNTYDFVGASVSKSITMNGKFNYHYDEALRTRGPNRGYVPVAWDEVNVSWDQIRGGNLDISTL